jgi:helix-turn-helix protein
MTEGSERGQSWPNHVDLSGESGWVTTEVAARSVRVSPRTIRRYIDQGRLEAKPQGEGVRREWLVSVDSLHALRASRTFEDSGPRRDRAETAVSSPDVFADSLADVLRDMAARLEWRAGEAAELRVRLELTERAQSTLEEERSRALAKLADERQRREEIEAERDELRRRLETSEEVRESPESLGPSDTSDPPRDVHTATESPQGQGATEAAEPRSWWSRIFGG